DMAPEPPEACPAAISRRDQPQGAGGLLALPGVRQGRKLACEFELDRVTRAAAGRIAGAVALGTPDPVFAGAARGGGKGGSRSGDGPRGRREAGWRRSGDRRGAAGGNRGGTRRGAA